MSNYPGDRADIQSAIPKRKSAMESGERAIAWARKEMDSCQAGTTGCCINHERDNGPCETW